MVFLSDAGEMARKGSWSMRGGKEPTMRARRRARAAEDGDEICRSFE